MLSFGGAAPWTFAPGGKNSRRHWAELSKSNELTCIFIKLNVVCNIYCATAQWCDRQFNIYRLDIINSMFSNRTVNTGNCLSDNDVSCTTSKMHICSHWDRKPNCTTVSYS